MIGARGLPALLPAHGVSSRQDLPLPFGYALTGAVVALVASFLALAFLWRTARFRGDAAGRELPAPLAEFLDSRELRGGLRLVGLLLVGFTAFAALAGPDLATNPTAGLVYVVFWVGLIPASLLFGPIWKLLNPLRTIHLALLRLLRVDPAEPPLRLPRWVGYWPGAIGLFSFVWLELCAPNRDSLSTLRTYFAVYGGLNLLGALAFGAIWFDRCDGFEAFSSTMGRLSMLGRRDDGKLVLRNPLENVDTVPMAPGLVGLLGVMLGSTAFDTFSSTAWWINYSYSSSLSPATLSTLALLISIGIVMTAFVAASCLSGLLSGRPPFGTAGQFAHSLVPIAVGYLIAHYLSLLVFAGQQALIRASDPLVNGSNWFGTAHRNVDYAVLTTTSIATIQVISIVTGHVLGVFSAHDRAVRLFPATKAVIGQLPIMALMVGYTIGGLSLLFQG
jgi:hypothetical protein